MTGCWIDSCRGQEHRQRQPDEPDSDLDSDEEGPYNIILLYYMLYTIV